MLIRQLEYLTALAREQHFARAAVACHVSQPALSSGIRKLEAELDVPIVRRGHHFEGFTPEGERVLRWAYRILAERDGLSTDVGAMRDGHTGTLRIGVLPSAAAALAQVAAGFGVRHPRVRLVTRSLPDPDIRRGLDEFRLDCGVIHLEAGAGPPRGTRLYRERYVLLTGEHGRFAERSAVRWSDLAHVPMCGFTPDPGSARVLGDVLARAGTTPAIQVETDSLAALYTHVREGGWCAVLSHAWLCSPGPPPGLRTVPMADPAVGPEVGLIIPERRPEPLLAREFLAFARSVPLQDRLDRAVPAAPVEAAEPPPGRAASGAE